MSKTLCILKPDAWKRNITGSILYDIQKSGFRYVALKSTILTSPEAQMFYVEHNSRSFFSDLVNYMSSGPITVLILSRDDAVCRFRNLLGNTDPREAQNNTLRNKYGLSKQENTIHGSDSDESAKREINFFFAIKDTISI